MKKLTVKDVAQRLGVAETTIRAGLQIGAFPFGTAYKKDGCKTWTYVLYPAKVAEYIGEREAKQ